MEKKLTAQGQKAFQRGDDTEDRSLPYKNWLRTQEANGFFLDVDMILFKVREGKKVPVAITELTRIDSDSIPGQRYLDAITNRIFKRDRQGEIIQDVGDRLGAKTYLVLFPPSTSWVYVFSFTRKQWKLFDPSTKWTEYLKTL